MHKHISSALKILEIIGMPKAQKNERSALCLLALLDLTQNKEWHDAQSPLIGITPIMEFCRINYGKQYAPNTRETFRRQTMHQFVEAGIVLYNPDKLDRPVNSPKAVYQIAPEVLDLIKSFQTNKWNNKLTSYLSKHQTLKEKYAKERLDYRIPLKLTSSKKLYISPGKHSELIKAIIEDFGPRFVPGGEILYVGETGNKWSYCDFLKLKDLGIDIDLHGKMPDIILYDTKKKWLILVESVTSHGPVNSKRHNELALLFNKSSVGLVYVTAFPSKTIMSKYIAEIAWETEIWVADAPSHLIHLNGIRFLGPYQKD